MVPIVLIIALIVAVGVAIWAAFNRDIDGALSAAANALFVSALLWPAYVEPFVVLGVITVMVWVFRRFDRTRP